MKRLAMFAAVAAVAGAASADVKKIDAKPVLDGRLDEAVWKQADWEGGFQRFRQSKNGRKPTAQTEFAILGDDDAIYLGVKAHHKKMDEVKSLGKIAIWEAEAVEFYFAPDGNTFDYYQFLITFQGLKHAIFYSESGNIRPDPYGPDWEVQVAETEGGWTAEARIPLSAFYMTRQRAWKTEWKMNVGRSYRDAGSCDFNCWLDGSGYRDLKNFRTVKGFPVRRAAEDLWIKSAVAQVKGPQAGRLAGELTFIVTAEQRGDFTLESGFTEPVKIKIRHGDNKFTVPAVFPKNGRHPLAIALKSEDGVSICRRSYPVIVDYQPIRMKLTSPAYRGNFYPGQDCSRIAGTVACAMEGKLEIVAVDAAGKRATGTVAPTGENFSFPIPGDAKFPITITAACGGEKLSKTVRRIELPTDGTHVSWIENGALVVDGKPVLRRNMYAEYYMGGEAFKLRYDADDLHQTKYVQSCGTLEPSRLIKGIEQKEGIRDVKPSEELFAKIDAVIERAKKGKGVYYYISDEPECRNVSPVYLKYVYDYVCEKDPNHVILSCSRAGETYIDCADWFETHPYINAHYVDGKRVYGRDFNTLGDFISAFNPEKHPDKCVGGTATCFSYSSGTYPTFTEYIANAWCEFLRGARTLYPYAYHDLGDCAPLYEGTRYLFSSAEALEDILLKGERRTLVKTSEYEAALWTMPDGERMFCVQNFTTAPLKAKVPGLAGTFREFRGGRRFDIPLSTSTFDLPLVPLESLVATTKKRGEKLSTFAETQAKIDRLEAERLGRPNQLLGRYLDVEFTSSKPGAGCRKLFDGTRDVIAWYDVWNKNKFVEMSFPKFVPEFSEITVYGLNIEDYRIKIRTQGEWKELSPVKTEKDGYAIRSVFDRRYSAVKLRVEFPKNKVELYEIELPGKVRETSRAGGDPKVLRHEDDWFVKTVPDGAKTNVWWYIRREKGQKYLSFDFDAPEIVKEGAYVNWGLYLNGGGGHVAGSVTHPIAGHYTLRIPDYDGEPRTQQMIIRNYNLALHIGDIVCSRTPPANRVEFVENKGQWAVRVTLEEKCEEVSCKLLQDLGRGPIDFSADGRSSIELRPTDGEGRVWAGAIPVPANGRVRNAKGNLPSPFVKVTVLGGAMKLPLLSWLDRKSDVAKKQEK